MTDVLEWSATRALEEIASGRISSRDYTEALLDRCQAAADLNAFIHLDRDAALAAAEAAATGPLGGLPIPVKDNFDTVGVATTAGTPALRGNVPNKNAAVVQKLLDAGAFVLGKLNMHELAYGTTSNNGAFGPVRNPYDPSRIPGGSSGGTGAAIGARMAPVGLGSDTGGSVRVPAALCGVIGFRPTTGRYSQQGIVPISNTRDTAGPLARSMDDIVLIDDVITGETAPPPEVSLAGLRIGVPRGYFFENLDPATAKIAGQALDALARAGAVLVEADIEKVGELDNAAGFPIALYETIVELNRYLREAGSPLDYAAVVEQVASPDVKGMLGSLLTEEGAMPEAVYREAMSQHRPALQANCARYYEENDLAASLFPTTPLPAAPIGDDETTMLNGEAVPTFLTFIRNTDPASVAGLPGLSLPAGLTDDGLPVGMELDGPAGTDRRLLAVGAAVARVLPTTPPPAV
jgi:Asp-tRNA(Asn)/Glu-tRNA(Gln) amidotransferase A subunit family amidase